MTSFYNKARSETKRLGGLKKRSQNRKKQIKEYNTKTEKEVDQTVEPFKERWEDAFTEGADYEDIKRQLRVLVVGEE